MLSYIGTLLPHHTINYGNIDLMVCDDMIDIYKYLALHNHTMIPQLIRLIMTHESYSPADCIRDIHIRYIAKYGPTDASSWAAFFALSSAISQPSVNSHTLEVVERYKYRDTPMLNHKLGYYYILKSPICETISYSDMVSLRITEDEVKYLSTRIDMNPILHDMFKSNNSSSIDKCIIASVNWKLVKEIERYIIFCLFYKIEIPLKEIYIDINLTPALVCIAVQYNIDIYERDILPSEYTSGDVFMLVSVTRKAVRNKAYKLLPSYIKSCASTQLLFR